MINRQLAMQFREASNVAQEYEQYLARRSTTQSQLKRPVELHEVTDPWKLAFVLSLLMWVPYAILCWIWLDDYKSTEEEWERYAATETSFVATVEDISEKEAREIVEKNYGHGEPPFYIPESVSEMLFLIVVGGILIFGLVFGALYLYNRNVCTLEDVLFGKANAARRAKNRPAEAQMRQDAQRLEALRQHYRSLGFPDVYFSSAVLRKMGDYVEAGRAQSFSQAANLYEQDKRHRAQLAEARRAQNKLAKQLERHHHAQMMSDRWLQMSIDDLNGK